MNAGALFLGDAVTAAGFRLAGLATLVGNVAAAPELLAEGLAMEPALLLIAEPHARALPPTTLDRLLASGRPPVVVLPVTGNHSQAGPLRELVLRTLGLATDDQPKRARGALR